MVPDSLDSLLPDPGTAVLIIGFAYEPDSHCCLMMYIKSCWQMATLIVYSRFTYLEPWRQQHSFPTTSETFRIHPSPVTIAHSLVMPFKDSATFGLIWSEEASNLQLVAKSSLLLNFVKENENTSILVAGGDDKNSTQGRIHSGLSLVHCYFNIKYLYVKGMSFLCSTDELFWNILDSARGASRPLCNEVSPTGLVPTVSPVFLSCFSS